MILYKKITNNNIYKKLQLSFFIGMSDDKNTMSL